MQYLIQYGQQKVDERDRCRFLRARAMQINIYRVQGYIIVVSGLRNIEWEEKVSKNRLRGRSSSKSSSRGGGSSFLQVLVFCKY